MKAILCTLIVFLGIRPTMAGSTFGLPNVAEPSAEDVRFIHERVLPKECHALSPKLSIEDIFRMRSTMDQEGDRGPRGRDYFEEISKVHLFRTLAVQKDAKGVHNVTFSSAFLTPPPDQIERTVSWLLTVMGRPSEVFTRDLSPKVPGDEMVAMVWKRDELTVGLSFHFASGLHSSLVVARAGTTAKDIFSTSGSKAISTNPVDVTSLIAGWVRSITTIKGGKEETGITQPAAKPADKAPTKVQPPTQSTKDASP